MKTDIDRKQLKKLMLDNDHTQKDLARILNQSVQVTNRKINGKQHFTFEDACRISDTYGVSIDALRA